MLDQRLKILFKAAKTRDDILNKIYKEYEKTTINALNAILAPLNKRSKYKWFVDENYISSDLSTIYIKRSLGNKHTGFAVSISKTGKITTSYYDKKEVVSYVTHDDIDTWLQYLKTLRNVHVQTGNS